MVAVAIPKIAPTFPSAGANISWIITIFGIVGAMSTALVGKMSDLWGKKKLLLACGIVFVVGSTLCAVTSDWAVLLFGRGLQACALGAPTVAYGLFRDILPRRRVPLAVGMVATGLGLSAIAAPLLGGWMLNHFSWRSIFWFQTIYTFVLLAVVLIVVPESKLRLRQRLDLFGAAALGGGIACILLYVSEGGSWGWVSGRSLTFLFLGVILLVSLVLIELRVEQPIIDMRVLLSPKVAMTLAAAFCAVFVISIGAYALPYMAQTPSEAQLIALTQAGAVKTGLPASALSVLHISFPSGTLAFAGGLTLLAVAWLVTSFQGVMSMLAGPLGGEWARRAGARKPFIAGLALLLATAVLLIFLPLQGVWGLAVVAAVMGAGLGFYFAAAPNLIIEAAPPEQQGITTGMWSVFGAVASGAATAVLTALFVANPLQIKTSIPGQPDKVTTIDQLYSWSGYVGGFYVAAGVAVLGLAITLLMKHGRTPSTGGVASEAPATPVPANAVDA
jgi:MFS family permease